MPSAVRRAPLRFLACPAFAAETGKHGCRGSQDFRWADTGIGPLEFDGISDILTGSDEDVERTVLDHVATEGLAKWKLQNSSDGNLRRH